MSKASVFIFCLIFCLHTGAQTPYATPQERNPNKTATYAEIIDFYRQMDKISPFVKLAEVGSTDVGKPLHLVMLSSDKIFDPKQAKKQAKLIFWVNNGIHPGEPEGIDASMALVRDFALQPELRKKWENVLLLIVPVYNVDGCLNRSSHSRANQNGPESYGFRGNAQNLDLNRDFIKCDSKNAQSFNRAFCTWQPDVFLDTHTSNGADYPYTMTLISSQQDKLQADLSAFMYGKMLPYLYENMQRKGWEMSPYIESVGETPDEKGIYAFLETARFSSGYAALHHCLSFIAETHMLKAFPDRVASTGALLRSMTDFVADNSAEIREVRQKALASSLRQRTFTLKWELDTMNVSKIRFKGYTAKYKTSEVSGLQRLYYDRNEPFEREIPHYNRYRPLLQVEAPDFYLIPQAYDEVLERLRWNGVQMKPLARDTIIQVELYKIKRFTSRNNPYEGHYLHDKVEVEAQLHNWQYHKGDYWIPVNQASKRYLIETLEPQADDSFFAWNFFDGILQQKEYFSAYVFEELATELLQKQPSLRAQLEAQKASDKSLAASAHKQLEWVYKHSPYYEQTHLLYPIGRVKEK